LRFRHAALFLSVTVLIFAPIPGIPGDAAAQSLPSGWSVTDIGGPSSPGSATFASPTLTVTSRGFDVNGTADQFTFAYTMVRGDVTLIARVQTLLNADPWTQAGLMIRDGTAKGARHAFAFITPQHGVALRGRITRNGATSQTAGGAGTAPVWLKLERRASTFTASRSADGVSWTAIGSLAISMSSNVNVGIAVASHSTATAATATLDTVSLNGTAWAPSNVAPLVSITSPANGASFVWPLSITLSATASDPDGTIQRVEFYVGTLLVGIDTTAPYSVVWPALLGTHSVNAVATDNAGAVTSSGWRDFVVTASTVLGTAVFTPASPADSVDYYVFEIFVAGANPDVAIPVATQNLGLPAVVSGECSVDVRATILSLAAGNYVATVAAVTSEGTLRSNTFGFVR